MAAGLCKNSWLPPSRISCSQFSHLLRESRKSHAKFSNIPHHIIASKSISEETQVPGWLRKIQGQTEICNLKNGRDFRARTGSLIWWLWYRWAKYFENGENDLSVKLQQKCGQMENLEPHSGSGCCADNSSSFPQTAMGSKLLLSIPTGQWWLARQRWRTVAQGESDHSLFFNYIYTYMFCFDLGL